MMRRRDRRESRNLRTAASLSVVGLTLALSIGIGIALGFYLDRWFKTNGLLVIVFTLLGVIAGFKQLIEAVVRASREQEAADREAAERERHPGEDRADR